MKSLQKFLFPVLLSGLFACDNGTQKLDENVTVNTTNPIGSVGGIVLNATTGAPIDDHDVSVIIIAGGHTIQATVGEDGVFSAQAVPASGPIQVTIEAEGYQTARLSGTFVTSAGDYPMGNAILTFDPVGLIPLNGSLRFRVIDSKGQPVKDLPLGITCPIAFLVWRDGTPTSKGRFLVTATTDGEGVAEVTGIPDFSLLPENLPDILSVAIPPVDTDGDGQYDYPGGTIGVYARQSSGPERTIVLGASTSGSLNILSSNLPGLETPHPEIPSVIAPDDTVYVLFNAPIDEDTLQVRLLQDAPDTPAGVGDGVETNTSVDGSLLTITFPNGLDAGKKYHLSIHAVSFQGNQPTSGDFYTAVFTQATETAHLVDVRVDPDSTDSPPALLLTFNQPVGTGIASHNTFNGSNCVVWFNFNISTNNSSLGDDPAEVGATSCNLGGLSLTAVEPLPRLPSGTQSGYTTLWRLSLPQSSGYSFGHNGPFLLKFSQITDDSRIVKTPDGSIVPDQTGTIP